MDKVVTDNKNKTKNQRNEAIENETKFDNTFNLSIRNKDPLTLVTFIIQGGKKQGATTVDGLTCLWDGGYTNSMIKIRHTKYYGIKMRYNKVEYSTAAGLYCTTHDVKVHLCMPDFSCRNIFDRPFHVKNDKGEFVIGYDMMIGRDLMIRLVLMADFKRQLPHWDGVTVPMKEPIGLIGKSNLTSCEMHVMVMQTAEPASTREATEILLKK